MEFYAGMLHLDPKLAHTYVEMLAANEIEELFRKGQSQLFGAGKLIDMLCAVCEGTSELESMCEKISKRMKQDLPGEDLGTVEAIQRRVVDLLDTLSIPAKRKYLVVKLLLDVVSVLKVSPLYCKNPPSRHFFFYPRSSKKKKKLVSTVHGACMSNWCVPWGTLKV